MLMADGLQRHAVNSSSFQVKTGRVLWRVGVAAGWHRADLPTRRGGGGHHMAVRSAQPPHPLAYSRLLQYPSASSLPISVDSPPTA